MANTRDIRNRIKSVKNTAQITRAMQLVAASKMKRAQNQAAKGRDYTKVLLQVLSRLQENLGEVKVTHPLFERREVRHRGILLISTDRGLCGPLNGNLFRAVADMDRTGIRFVNIGRKGRQFLARSKRDLLADFHVSDQAPFREVRPVVQFLVQAFEEGKIDTIEVLFPHFVNTLIQEPRLVPLVPLADLSDFIADNLKEFGEPVSEERDFVFEQSPERLVQEILDLFVAKIIYQRVLESKASEHSARMVAMKAATDNAKNLVDDLTLEYNKARQAAITQEILEISAAAMANA